MGTNLVNRPSSRKQPDTVILTFRPYFATYFMVWTFYEMDDMFQWVWLNRCETAGVRIVSHARWFVLVGTRVASSWRRSLLDATEFFNKRTCLIDTGFPSKNTLKTAFDISPVVVVACKENDLVYSVGSYKWRDRLLANPIFIIFCSTRSSERNVLFFVKRVVSALWSVTLYGGQSTRMVRSKFSEATRDNIEMFWNETANTVL